MVLKTGEVLILLLQLKWCRHTHTPPQSHSLPAPNCSTGSTHNAPSC